MIASKFSETLLAAENLTTKLTQAISQGTDLTPPEKEFFDIEITKLRISLSDKSMNTRYGAAILDCIADTLREYNELSSKGHKDDAIDLVQIRINPLIKHLECDLKLWLGIYLDSYGMTKYRDAQVNELISLRKKIPELLAKSYTYDVTICVTAFNKLEYTKMAVDSILRHTDMKKYKIELILIDNGSSDLTYEYFKSVPGAKIIRLRHPLGYPATALGAFAAKGKYYVHFANDIIATQNWLDNLLDCILSDSLIGMAVPVCNNMSSGQSVIVNYPDPMLDLSGLEDFAKDYNVHNPLKWEERVRLLPCMCIMPAVLASSAASDSLFHYGEFADDDVSTRLRRAGFRQIFAADTFVHHFGSITSGNAQKQENSLEISRNLFYKKWDVDAWASIDWDLELARYAAYEMRLPENELLWIDPLFCAIPVKTRDICSKCGITIKGSAITTNASYLPDALGVLDRAICETLDRGVYAYKDKRFHAVIFCRDIAMYSNMGLAHLFRLFSDVLEENGKIIFTSHNSQWFGKIDSLYRNALLPPYSEQEFPALCLNQDDILHNSSQCGYRVVQLSLEKPLSADDRRSLADIHGLSNENQPHNRFLYILTRA